MKKTFTVDNRLIKMIDEMLGFFYSYSVVNIKMEIDRKEEYSEMTFDTKLGKKIEQSTLNRIERLLSAPRQHEMEEYYWGVAGTDTTTCSELVLVGMMTDEHDLNYNEEEDKLYVRLRRYKTHR